MQNANEAHSLKMNKSFYSVKKMMYFILLLLTFCMLFISVALSPEKAFAKSYDMPKVDITAQAQTDGSLQVVEQRTFSFSGHYTSVWWTFSNLPSNASLKVNSVRMVRVDDKNSVMGDWKSLPSVPFVSAWRKAGGPGNDAFSLDSPKNTVYAFFDVDSDRVTIEVDYSIVNGVQAYKDIGEVYWQYVGSQWAEASSNVTMQLALPVPQGTSVIPGDNVRAWGHGPLDGTVDVGQGGTTTYKVAHVNAGQFAEARVVFPVSWLTNLSADALKLHQSESYLEKVLSEEKTWSDQANRDRIFSLGLIIGCGVVCVLVLIWALWAYFRFGKEYHPDFTGKYWRDVPEKGTHPAIIGRLWRWNRESQQDLTATLMYLSHCGAIRIESGMYEKSKHPGKQEPVQGYYITKVPEIASSMNNPIDKEALSFVFDTVAQGATSLWFESIQVYGKQHPQKFVDAMKTWQGILSAETNKHDYFEFKSNRYHGYMMVLSVVWILASIVMGLAGNLIPLIFMVPTAIVLVTIANYMPRRTVEGNNLVAKCKALRNWLRDFSLLDERPSTDVKVWGEFMVYAYVFGIAKQVMNELRTKVPQVLEQESVAEYGFVPWWFWYAPTYGANGVGMPAMSDVLQSTLSRTMASAQAATSGASGNFSSGGGFGGGFSSGGGGGFGGGGGAR